MARLLLPPAVFVSLLPFLPFFEFARDDELLFYYNLSHIAVNVGNYVGAAGTLNSDQARDFNLPLKERFFLQPLPPAEAAQRVKESAKEIVNVKEFIDRKAWPYVQNDLRLRAEYLRYDLNTVISAKPKEEKKTLKDLTGKLFQDISNVSPPSFLPPSSY